MVSDAETQEILRIQPEYFFIAVHFFKCSVAVHFLVTITYDSKAFVFHRYLVDPSFWRCSNLESTVISK